MTALDKTALTRLHSIIADAREVVIATHTHPDGDALGSSLGLRNFLDSPGRKATVLLPDPIPDTLAFIPSGRDMENILICSEDSGKCREAAASCDLIVCLDFNHPRRSEGLEGIITGAGCTKILIDHHQDPARDQFDLVFSECEISSACELLYHILLTFPGIDGDASRLPKETAEDLLTGMTTDTNNFANSVYPSTFTMASELIAAGVDRDRILSDIYNNYREERFRALGHLLLNKLTITDDGVAYMVLTAEEIRRFDIREGDTEAFVNQPLGMAKVRMSIFLKEQADYFRVSIRSKKGTSANRCSRLHFNGGGHEQASGGRLYIGKDIKTPEDAPAYIETVTHKFLSNE